MMELSMGGGVCSTGRISYATYWVDAAGGENDTTGGMAHYVTSEVDG